MAYGAAFFVTNNNLSWNIVHLYVISAKIVYDRLRVYGIVTVDAVDGVDDLLPFIF